MKKVQRKNDSKKKSLKREWIAMKWLRMQQKYMAMEAWVRGMWKLSQKTKWNYNLNAIKLHCPAF